MVKAFLYFWLRCLHEECMVNGSVSGEIDKTYKK